MDLFLVLVFIFLGCTIMYEVGRSRERERARNELKFLMDRVDDMAAPPRKDKSKNE